MGDTDVLGTTHPALATRTADRFLQLLRLRRPHAETGQPDWEQLVPSSPPIQSLEPAVQATINS